MQVLDGSIAGKIARLYGDVLTLGRANDCDLIFAEPEVSWSHLSLRWDGVQLLATDLGSTNGTFLEGHRLDSETCVAQGEVLSLAQSVHIRFQMLTETEIELAEKLYRGATRDHLTGLLNRVSFYAHLEQEMALFLRSGRSFGLLMMDLDHFKQVNDRFGHAAGDDLLRQFGQCLKDHLRVEDLTGRVGGEEFCSILRTAQVEDCQEVAERIRREVCRLEFCFLEKGSVVTYRPSLSGGITVPHPADSLGGLMDRADTALYRAKENGRNRIETA